MHHKKPLADGGTDDLDNIEPKQRDEHVREHMENGDFSRWGKKGPPQKKQKQQERQPQRQTESESEAENEKPADAEPNKPGSTATESEPVKNPMQSANTPHPRAGSGTSHPRPTRPHGSAMEEEIEEALMARVMAEDALVGLILDY